MTCDPRPTSLHHPSGWGVHRCACGQFTLKLGALRLDLSPEEFASLAQLLERAAQHFERAEPADRPMSAGSVAH